jgi:prevent-host-death family protein
MKVIPLSEAKAKLSQYGQLCHDEPVVITVNGKPFFQLVPLNENDDLIDRLLEQHPGFRHLLEQRLGERSLSSATAERQFAATGTHPLTRAGNKRRAHRTRSQ